jgi:hypothetical protein
MTVSQTSSGKQQAWALAALLIIIIHFLQGFASQAKLDFAAATWIRTTILQVEVHFIPHWLKVYCSHSRRHLGKSK